MFFHHMILNPTTPPSWAPERPPSGTHLQICVTPSRKAPVICNGHHLPFHQFFATVKKPGVPYWLFNRDPYIRVFIGPFNRDYIVVYYNPYFIGWYTFHYTGCLIGILTLVFQIPCEDRCERTYSQGIGGILEDYGYNDSPYFIGWYFIPEKIP